jgi:predicted dithiol-disulfide oxidoreductase (DUF899 family)
MTTHRVVSHDEWIAARRQLLIKEKEFTRLRDQLSQQRRDLPWEPVSKEYVFDGPNGKQILSELFDGRSQLIVYHFMFNPKDEVGCPHCSFWADSFNNAVVHLNQRDVTMVAISRAPYAKLAAYEQRMGWTFKWLSSGDTEFNFDFQASFTPQQVVDKEALYNFTIQDPGGPDREGLSVFFKDSDGQIFHTYSAYARGIDMINATYQLLDLAPNGRDENGRGPYWVRRHDEYAARRTRSRATEQSGSA